MRLVLAAVCGALRTAAHSALPTRRRSNTNTRKKMVINALERQGAPNIRTTGSAGIQRKAEKLKRGTFAEEAFEEIGDTVLIWSLQRYFGKPLLSHYHLEAIARGKRGKRVSGTTQTTAKAEGESSSAAPPTRVRERRERRAKFA
eukprot:CAMPEP_0171787664 /NCGR_PEP_ID=MMETSP0991-20121206/64037_1 /TAXON_ID=483369 /ORGANISM="non described non described, Strain CCMP2098" /LENGTH=144 /DNA_ID=CAMNT_0012396663 /DNA_START=125 /DNA_END=555 /DNA_ORIENTATION=-